MRSKRPGVLGPGGKVVLIAIGGVIGIALLWIFVINPVFLTRSTGSAATSAANATANTDSSSTTAQNNTNTTSSNNNNNTSSTNTNTSNTTATNNTTPVVTGQIVDANDGSAVASAVISAGQTKLATTDNSGNFQIFQKLPSGSITISANGYSPMTVDSKTNLTTVKLTPNIITGTITDAATKLPLSGMPVKSGNNTTNTDKDGKFSLSKVQDGDTLEVTMEGYAPISQKIDLKSGANLSIEAQSTQFNGTITDAQTSKPVQNATLTLGSTTVTTTVTGTFTFPNAGSNDAKIKVRAPGYKIQDFSVADARNGIKLTPFKYRGVYVPGVFAIRANYNDLFVPYLQMADKGEINSIVVAVKNDDDGSLFYDSQTPQAKQYNLVLGGGKNPAQLIDIQHLLDESHKHGLYVVARFVVMRDPKFASADAKVAVRDTRTGGIWKDNNSQLTWVNPFSQDTVDYTTALSKELAGLGFDEVQLDYIRFPADPPLRYTDFGNGLTGDFVYSDPTENPKAYDARTKAIDKIVSSTYDVLKKTNTFLSLDVFGVTLWRTDDNNIGQQYNDLAMISDYICPMVYPSHFLPGTMNYDDPGNHPKEIIQQSGKYSAIVEDKIHPVARYRPWLEDFDYPWGKHPYKYGPDKVQAQIDAADNSVGETGWTLWNAKGNYTDSVLLKVGNNTASK